MPNRAHDWLNQAVRDLEQAKDSQTAGRQEWACFAAQQAAEGTSCPRRCFGVYSGRMGFFKAGADFFKKNSREIFWIYGESVT